MLTGRSQANSQETIQHLYLPWSRKKHSRNLTLQSLSVSKHITDSGSSQSTGKESQAHLDAGKWKVEP